MPVVEVLPATDFIKKLIVHIPDKHFKMIRYYGVYAKKHKQSHKIFMAVPKPLHSLHRQLANWRLQMQSAFGLDPLWCTHCNTKLTLVEICHKGTPLTEIDSRRFAVF
jgi:hypothetical protein